MQICTLLQTDNHGSTPPLSFLQAGCPSCHPTNSIEALNATKLVAILTGVHLCWWSIGSDCSDYEDAEEPETSAVAGRSAESTVAAIQTQSARH